MKIPLMSVAAVFASLGVTLVACGSDESDNQTAQGGASGKAGAGASGGSSNDAAGGSGGSSGDAGSAGMGGSSDDGSAGANAGELGFTPSNLPADLDLPVTDDMIFSGETCAARAEIDTDKGEIRCYEPGLVARHPYFVYKLVKQGDGSEVAVFAAKNIVGDAQVEIEVVGQRPLVLIAPGNVTLRGTLKAIHDSVYTRQANAGGFSAPASSPAKGLGPGGGGASSATADAGGAGYCGTGGKGGGIAAGAIGAAGASYGVGAITPLIGGSSGGRGTSDSGAGGGAVQVIAGAKFDLGTTGVIDVGGAAGGWGGSGAGSGGSILIESPEVSIAGILAANGGGGGGQNAFGKDGSSASADANFAPGGAGGTTTAVTGKGGDGAADKTINGANGGTTGGGGAGGAGRIRINSNGSQATVSGTVSPSLETTCATQGELNP